MEKELTAAVTTQEPMLADSLIVVQQLPVIKEQLSMLSFAFGIDDEGRFSLFAKKSIT